MGKDNSKVNDVERSGNLYQLAGKPPLGEALPLALQHVAAMIVGCVTPAIILSATGGLSAADSRILIQAALIISGIATLLQITHPFGKIGSGLPIIMGVSFAYLPTMLGIVQEYNLNTILGSQLIAGCIGIIIGIFIKYLRKFFPPVVTGTVIFTIGLSLFPTAVRYMAGGAGSANFSSPQNWICALLTMFLVLFFNNFTRGFTKLASILLAMIIGYVIAIPMGLVDVSSVGSARWFMLPAVGHFALEFHAPAIISLSVIMVVGSVEALGQFSALSVGALNREPTTEELSHGLIANGLSTLLGGFFGGLPTSTFGQNVGIVITNKVVNRAVIGIAACFLLIAGFVPKISAILLSIPSSVLGGATISVFATITMTGIRLFTTDGLTMRTQAIVGISAALGMGITSVQGSLALLPAWMNSLFGNSAVVVATIMAILLNIILPKDAPAAATAEKVSAEGK